jgi:hypothetical protein
MTGTTNQIPPAGDTRFIGVDERGDPGSLPPGYVASARNARFYNLIPQTRPGITLAPWARNDGFTPFEQPQGVLTYLVPPSADNPDGQQFLLVVADGRVWRTAPNSIAQEVPLDASITLTGDVEMTQAMGVVVMGRGFGSDPLVMRNLGTGFDEITQTNSEAGNGTGTLPIGPHTYATYVQNRLVVAALGDQGYVSDILNYTRYSIGNAFRVHQGAADELLRFVKFNDDNLIAFKRRSIVRISNLVPDQYGDWSSAVQDEVTTTHGLAAPKAIARYGADLFYLTSELQVTSLRLTEENKFKTVDLPLSHKLPRSFARINSNYASGAVMAAWDNKLYLAAPVDDATIEDDTNLVATGATYDYTTSFTLSGLIPGARYRYTQGASDIGMVNGTESFAGDTIFTAQGNSITLQTDQESTAVTATVNLVKFEGVNNALFVYDFIHQEWAGVDEADGIIAVKDFFQVTVNGRLQLGFLHEDGTLRLVETEDAASDEQWQPMSQPYVDVLVNTTPSGGVDALALTSGPLVMLTSGDLLGVTTHRDTIQVNSGTLVAADSLTSVNGTYWGADTLAHARTNLWEDSAGAGGFNPSATSPWSAPNTTPTEIDEGVRFTATNGVPPVVTVTGTWALLDAHSGNETVDVDIDFSIDTRGYTHLPGAMVTARTLWVQLETWAPSYTLTAVRDGVSETRTLASAVTKSRTRFTTFGTATFDEGNDDTRFEDAYREDYSLVLPDTGFEPGTSGVALDLKQRFEHGVSLFEHAQFTQIRVRNTAGRVSVPAIAATATAGSLHQGANY